MVTSAKDASSAGALSLASGSAALMLSCMNVTLPPELATYAAEAIATGRYRNHDEVVAAGLQLLRQQEDARAELLASVLAAKEEADRDGWLTGDEVVKRAEATIARRTGAAA